MHKSEKTVVLFVLSYVLLYVLYAIVSFLPKWDAYGYRILSGQALTGYLFVDPLYLFIPFVGFFLMIAGLSWAHRLFKDERLFSIFFAFGFIVVSYFAFFVALVGYFWNNAFLLAQSQGVAGAGFVSFGQTVGFVIENFWDRLLGSPYFLFVLAALLGWVSFVIVHNHWKDAHHSSHAHIPSSA